MKLFIIAVFGFALGYVVSIWLPPSEVFSESETDNISTEDAPNSEIGMPAGLIDLEQESKKLAGVSQTGSFPKFGSGEGNDADQESATNQTQSKAANRDLEYHLKPSDFLATPGDTKSFGLEVNGLIETSNLSELRSNLSDYPEVFTVRFQQPNGRAGAKVFLGTFADRDSAKLSISEQVKIWPNLEFSAVALPDCIVNGPEDEDGFKCGPPPEQEAAQ